MIAPPLYLICLAIELVYAFIRFLVAALAATALGWGPDTTGLVALGVAMFPPVWSILTFLGVHGGWGLMWEYGARRPSTRDRVTVDPILSDLRRRGAARPWLWLVIDDPSPNAQAVGRTVYISSGLIGHPSLAPVLAHELGHFGALGSDMLLALIRLEVPGLRSLRVYLELTGRPVAAGLVRTLSGGASWQLPIMRSLWRGHFRRHERHADRVARRLGHGPELAAYLDTYERPLETASAFRRGRTHPYAEHRIAGLDSQHPGGPGLLAGFRDSVGRSFRRPPVAVGSQDLRCSRSASACASRSSTLPFQG
jgi:Zn-dependent protease with chaperone function